MATTSAVTVTARDHSTVPVMGSGAMACVKYVAYTKVTTSVVNGELAKSYSAQDQMARGP